MRWDQDPPGSLARLVSRSRRCSAERPRRQDAERVSRRSIATFVDYILRCTHRIWEQKNIGLCRTHYADTCVMHTLNGPNVGRRRMWCRARSAPLPATPTASWSAEDVIWSEHAPGTFLSSHRITSDGTQLGDETALGTASIGYSSVTTIADCLCRENLIVEEWLVRDNIRAAWQNGLDPWTVARAQAGLDQTGDQDRHAWRWEDIAQTRDGSGNALGRSPGGDPRARASARPGERPLWRRRRDAVGHRRDAVAVRPPWLGPRVLDRVLAADPRRDSTPPPSVSITGRLGPCRTATSRWHCDGA